MFGVGVDNGGDDVLPFPGLIEYRVLCSSSLCRGEGGDVLAQAPTKLRRIPTETLQIAGGPGGRGQEHE